MLFIDESGSITRNRSKNNRYFIIAMAETNNPQRVRRKFYKYKKNYVKKHSSLQLDYTKEIKGSQMPLAMKRYILKNLIDSTDVSLHYIIIDNWNLVDNFYDNVELCFNFVTGNFLGRFLKKYFDDFYELEMVLDERNCTIKSLNSLKDYLKIKLCLDERIIKDIVKCEYADSREYAVLQVTDVFSNLVWRACQEELFAKPNPGNANLLEELMPGDNMYFPYKKNTLSFYNDKNVAI
ncbi:DUF3800 domain-containing protein [Limosilactobacillus reuteri]|uniref:DUF3800 domain-containing protein n=1 Tax=Limosilactobacillus reuteri TaxID=1598 RepID=UPI002F268EDC